MVVEGIHGSIGLTPAQGGEDKLTLPIDGAPAAGFEGDGTNPASRTGAVSFEDLLAAEVNNANALGHAAEAKAGALAQGTLDDIHGTMIASKEAEISLHLVGTIRNHLLDAFHELWRTSA
jgi:flagellar hook-basal body complex protein FliE